MALKPKPVILLFVDWFWPGYLAGGPVQSVISLVQQLNSEIDFRVVTSSHDLRSTQPYEGIMADQWQVSPLGCQVYYASPTRLSRDLIKELIQNTRFDRVLINSFYSKYFSVLPLQELIKLKLANRVILAPRGMLSPGALAIKPLKKRLFRIYSRFTRLHQRIRWLASSQTEAEEIRKYFSDPQIHVISNLPRQMNKAERVQKTSGILRLLFLSRISPIKNLHFALEVLGEIRQGDIEFSIYGPVEDPEYWEHCRKLIAALPGEVRAHYKGIATAPELDKIYAGHHFLFLPTLNENFGHVIAESLLSGCPVIISDQTPWTNVNDNQAGFAFPVKEKKNFMHAIKNALEMTEADMNIMSRAASDFAKRSMDISRIKNQYLDMFYGRL